jgi:hypothetical protein
MIGRSSIAAGSYRNHDRRKAAGENVCHPEA